jgi:diketogulonate reductase-like aldo/keto reductase
MQNEALVRYSESRGMIVTGWGCIGRGIQPGSGKAVILDDPVLNEVAGELGKPVVNVLIRFLQQLSPAVVVLAKSVTPERILSNSQLEFSLNEGQMKKLRGCERSQRLTPSLDKWGHDIFADEW